jgi:hypothetical protein
VTTEGHVGQASYANAAAALAGRVLDAVHGTGEVGLAHFLDSCADATAGLGAVRLVGADVFAPRLLLDRPLDPRDVEIVDESFAVFPCLAAPVPPGQRVMAWRDWATAGLLARLDGRGPVAPPPVDAAQVLGDSEDWQRWSVAVAQLSPLAQHGAGGVIADLVCRDRVELVRGVTRAVLRRDHNTAARLARWVALVSSTGVGLPLDPALLIEHIRLHAGTDPRLQLDLAIARHLLGSEPV